MRATLLAPAASAALLTLVACSGTHAGGTPPTLTQQTAQRQASSESFRHGGEFNERGNILIADQFNNRVIEIDPPSHAIVWSFGGVLGVNDAERVGELTLIAGTGVPAASPPLEPQCASGCADNRVLLLDPRGRIVWQYGTFNVTGSGPNQLNTPVQATALPNGNILITDQGNQRVIEVDRHKRIVFQYGTTGVSGIGPNELNNPNSAELLEDGNILIADESNNRVIEVNRAKQVLWQYPDPLDPSKLNGAAFASRLPDGHTLITDSNNNRVIEVDRDKQVVWTYSTLVPGGNSNPLPTRAVRLRDGDTLISDQFNDRVILVRKTGRDSGAIEFTQGMLNEPGAGFNELNAPYDAKAIGDYTGLTNPRGE